MVRWSIAGHFASHHSPTREQREVFYNDPKFPFVSDPHDGFDGKQEQNIEMLGKGSGVAGNPVERTQSEARYDLSESLSNTLPVKRTIESLEKVRSYVKPKGIKVSFEKADDFASLYQTLGKTTTDAGVHPNAFRIGNQLYFNIDHADFATHPEAAKLRRRAVVHETTHVIADRTLEDQTYVSRIARILLANPEQWKLLREALQGIYDTDYIPTNDGFPALTEATERIAHEAIAIYVTNKNAPLESQDPNIQKQREITTLVERFAAESPALAPLLEAIEKGVGKELSEAKWFEQFDEARKEREEHALVEDMLGTKTAPASPLFKSPDNGVDLAAEELLGAEKKSDEKKLTPDKVMAAIKKAKSSLAEVKKEYPGIRAAVESSPILSPEDRAQSIAAIGHNLEYLGQQANDLALAEHYTEFLGKWTAPADHGGLSLEEKSLFAKNNFEANPYAGIEQMEENTPEQMQAKEKAIQDADNATKAQREEMLKCISTSIASIEKPLETIAKAIDASKDLNEDPHAHAEGGVWEWVKANLNPFSGRTDGSVVWLTPLNIVAIFKIYKDAITQNYQSNQKVKENSYAKKINVYKPIQHTLNKLARSTNNTETSEFKEYIEKEGFTFDQVFGPDGRGLTKGLLFDNRHNFNRAKAVLEYAADHAWLYFLDPLHGHDVYGFDYEEIEGLQSFEELVQKNEGGKKHQIDHGVERVDKSPDVVPIMNTLVHELRHKNIFAVQGIMQRLQDKAKFSHSHTWMLTTLLMLIRDEAKHDRTLLYCLDKGMIDNISNHTIQQSAWSITWLKMMRTPIMRWKETTDNGRDGFGNNILTKTMEQIERRLEAAGMHFPENDEKARLDKYEAIGIVLAGKTLHENATEDRFTPMMAKYGWNPGAKISIFEGQFDEYRKEYDMWTEQASADPGKTDPDYFNVRVGGSDIMMLNLSQMVKILKKTSTAVWQEDEKARGFFAQVFARHEELSNVDLEARDRFVKELQKKLSDWWRQEMDESRRKQFEFNTDQLGDNISAELIARDLVDEEVKKQMQAARDKAGLEKIVPKSKSPRKGSSSASQTAQAA